MKTWTLPIAEAQKFAANEYVSACYKIYCGGHNDNAFCTNLFASDGVTSIANPPYEGARFKGCGGYHRVVGEGEPENNGYVEFEVGGEQLPVFYWFGDVLDVTEAGDMADFHFTDLTNDNAVIYNEDPNHS